MTDWNDVREKVESLVDQQFNPADDLAEDPMDNWESKMLPYATSDVEREVLTRGASSWITALCKQTLKARYMKMVGVVEEPPEEPKQYASY